MKRPRAVITGVTGQDGSYLVELLLARGYEVHGVVRPSTTQDRMCNLAAVLNGPRVPFELHQADMGHPEGIAAVIRAVDPDEVYNLAGQSHVGVSFALPDLTLQVSGFAVAVMLEAVRDMGGRARFYQASTSEIFGGMPGTDPQDEGTALHPRSPYGVAKAAAYWIVRNYREAYGLHASNGILFNHESPRRGFDFVTRKITRAVARIVRGQQERLTLGTLDPLRDWGYAPEYVEAMAAMVLAPASDDYVVATGKSHSVREFVSFAFEAADMPLVWEGSGRDERGFDRQGNIRVDLDPTFARPAEVMVLRGNAAKVEAALGWRARTTGRELAHLMVKADLE